jgi:hypothetical protein
LKRLLRELDAEKAPGPAHSFSATHVVRALELISERPIGRTLLSERLLLGEGATRTLLERLKAHGLVKVERKGCTLTSSGLRAWKVVHEALPRKAILNKSGLTVGSFNAAVLVKRGAGKVKSGLEQRDAALMAGAKGATTLVYRRGRLTVPPDYREVAEDFPAVSRKIIDSLVPDEGDAVVVGSAETLEKAEYGGLAAALTLIEDMTIDDC